jgi:hypothetical protein
MGHNIKCMIVEWLYCYQFEKTIVLMLWRSWLLCFTPSKWLCLSTERSDSIWWCGVDIWWRLKCTLRPVWNAFHWHVVWIWNDVRASKERRMPPQRMFRRRWVEPMEVEGAMDLGEQSVSGQWSIIFRWSLFLDNWCSGWESIERWNEAIDSRGIRRGWPARRLHLDQSSVKLSSSDCGSLYRRLSANWARLEASIRD